MLTSPGYCRDRHPRRSVYRKLTVRYTRLCKKGFPLRGSCHAVTDEVDKSLPRRLNVALRHDLQKIIDFLQQGTRLRCPTSTHFRVSLVDRGTARRPPFILPRRRSGSDSQRATLVGLNPKVGEKHIFATKNPSGESVGLLRTLKK